MQQVRCTNCGSTAIVPDGSGEFCKCEACGSTFYVPKASAFSRVVLDHTQDVRAWREYLAKQLRLQQESSKARDYGGVKLFAQKILSVLPDDFCATYYTALSEKADGNDTAYMDFLANADLGTATPDEVREVVDSVIATAEPKHIDRICAFIKRAYPSTHTSYELALEKSVKSYIQKLSYARDCDRDVFICHRTAEPDQDIADAICTRLEERGLRCWIAPRNILAGSQNYERDIIKGVENCRIFLVVTSYRSIYSDDCETELKAAVLADKALYSYRIDDTEYDGTFKKALSGVQWLDACDDPYAHLEQLVIDIKSMLAEDAREKAELEEKRLEARERERVEAERRRDRDRERLDRIEKIMAGGSAMAGPSGSVRTKLKRAEIEVSSGNFERAETIADGVLDIDPECAEAWWLLLLCRYGARTEEELARTGKDFTADAYYKNAERFADESFMRRMDNATAELRLGMVKSVNAALDEADKRYIAEDYKGLQAALDECAPAFATEGGLLYTRFPDVVSRYYWLRLWAKYGQSPLVCVEDITRESEYKNALRYASPAQAADYEDARATVSKNAQAFLRERSKTRSNDSKLSDYLVDNRGILPPDIYNYYSSLLYFRKMLVQLNMTEAQLKSSTVDISTNEYFMLAQSLATDAQKQMYDNLTETLDANRAKKSSDDDAERAKRESDAKWGETKSRAGKAVRTVALVLTASLSYLLFFVGIIYLAFDRTMTAGCLCASAIFRLGNDITRLVAGGGKASQAVTLSNLIMSIFTIMASVMADIFFGYYGYSSFVNIVTIASLTIEGMLLARLDKQNKRRQ